MTRFTPLALLSAVMATGAMASTISDLGSQCPSDWSASQFGNSDKVYCCPGSSHIQNDDGYCCLDSSSNVIGSGYHSLSDGGFSVDFKRVRRIDIPEPSCAATVDYKDPDYSSKVSSLSKSLNVVSTQGSGNKPASATATTTSSGAQSTSGDSTSDGAQAASTSDKGNAGAMPTAEIMGGVLAMAAALAL